ncbi:MAG: hypothetical protein CL398_10820 [Acidiferrobacteraceae bacterium]|nr:hypothetical protein [Acidiferrobacteraceae bacterium]
MDPSSWIASLRKSFFDLDIFLPVDARVVLFGSAGTTLWDLLTEDKFSRPDPIDTYAEETIRQAVKLYWGEPAIQWLYPGSKIVPLQRLCREAGWSHASPLGLDIHSQYGTWFACRGALVIDLPLASSPVTRSDRPCDTCYERACQVQCPASAVNSDDDFNLNACINYRTLPQSRCADKCLARLSCPAGETWQYGEHQVRYHSGLSLEAIRQFNIGHGEQNMGDSP